MLWNVGVGARPAGAVEKRLDPAREPAGPFIIRGAGDAGRDGAIPCPDLLGLLAGECVVHEPARVPKVRGAFREASAGFLGTERFEPGR